MRINTTELYTRYQKEQSDSKLHCSTEIALARKQKNQLIESAKRKGRFKRAAIKLLAGSKLNKKLLYALTSKTLKEDINQARAKYSKKREVIYNKFQNATWIDWLQRKALDGEKEALAALRSREKRQALKGNRFTGIKVNNNLEKSKTDQITKMGTIIYHQENGAIRDDGKFLKISRGSSTKGIAEALNLAIQRYGHCISVKGSENFKEQVAQVAAELKLNIAFESPQLEQRRQYLLQTITEKEINHESRKPTIKPRGTNRSNNEIPGARRNFNPKPRSTGNKQSFRWSPKPNLGQLGQAPPPAAKNCLRNLSQLGLVQFSSRSEMLLPSHVPRNLEHQGTQPHNELRRCVSWTGSIRMTSDAADKYIAEREAKRQTIPNILKHRRYCSKDLGAVQLAGIRQVDGESLSCI